MKPFLTALGFFFFCLCMNAEVKSSPTPAPSPSPTPTLREVINNLDSPQIQKTLEALQSHFLNPESLDEISKQRALLEGLIQRLSPGVKIVPANPVKSIPSSIPFLAEILNEHTGYLRLGMIDSATLTQMDAALSTFQEKKIPAIILDLRAVPAGGDFGVAADFARRFCPKGKILFTIQKPSTKQERILTSNQDPLFGGILVVLTDADTSGAAEALAATLRLNAKAMIVGENTSGEAVEFTDIPLGSGQTLRVAASQIILPDGSAIFPEGIKPDIAISLPPEMQSEIFEMSRKKGVSQFVFESERPHLNEAALVANTNPEVEETQVAQKERNHPPLFDTVLQRAVDLITAIGFYQKQNETPGK